MADWNELFNREEFIATQPHPVIYPFMETLPEGSIVYDLGCGAGRHIPVLQEKGFRVIASDISMNGLSLSRRHDGETLSSLFCASMDSIPIANCSMDGVLSVNVINHGTWDIIQNTMDEVHRILTPGGKFTFLVIATDDLRFGSGMEIEPRTYIPQNGSEAGIPHHFFNEDDVKLVAEGWEQSEWQLVKRYRTSKDKVFAKIPDGWGEVLPYVVHYAVELHK